MRLDIVLTGKRHPFLADFEAGFDGEGKLHGVKLALYSDGGWSLDLSEPVLWRAPFFLGNFYFFPARAFSGDLCKNPKKTHTAFSGVRRPPAVWLILGNPPPPPPPPHPP